jgi:5-dehydro-2-deoxygluconokinase
MPHETPDVLTVGRVSVDLYAQQIGASFSDPQTFAKSVGGSPTNVAVAAARLGQRAAIITKVGADPLGDYVVAQLDRWGVDTHFIGRATRALTPVVLAALDPPEDPQIIFYRGDGAPDTTIATDDVPAIAIRECRVLWMSAGALAEGATAQASFDWLAARERAQHTILDLDYRPSFWSSVEEARTAAQRAIALSTVVVGNRTECDMAVGHTDADAAADALLAAGVELAIVKLGADGVLLATAAERTRVAPIPVEVICGLGAGDAFGGALIHGLLEGWDLARIGQFANGAGAFVASQLTCADAMPTTAIVEALIADRPAP